MNETLEEMARALFKSWFVDFTPVKSKAAGKKPFGIDEATAALFPDTFQHSTRGQIPSGWELRSVSEVQDGARGTAAGPFGSNLTRSDYVDAGVPVIRGESMSGNEPWLNDSTFVFVTIEKAEELASNTARPGDLVFTQRGTLGQVALIPPNSAFPTYVLSQSQMRLRSSLSPLFLYFHFSSTETIENILANSTAAGVPHINLGFLRQMTLCPFSADVVAAFESSAGSWMTKHLRDTLLPRLLSGELPIKDAEKLVGDAT
jgi:type I restriction enzyme S subunit